MLIIYKPYHTDDSFTCLSHKCIRVIKVLSGEILLSVPLEEEMRPWEKWIEKRNNGSS